MMSALSEMAVRVIVYLALHKDIPISVCVLPAEIRATSTAISAILQRLLLADIVHTPNGVFGGYCLLRRPESLSFYDIIYAIESETSPTRSNARTPMRQLGDTRQQLETTYRTMTIAQYLRDGVKT